MIIGEQAEELGSRSQQGPDDAPISSNTEYNTQILTTDSIDVIAYYFNNLPSDSPLDQDMSNLNSYLNRF